MGISWLSNCYTLGTSASQSCHSIQRRQVVLARRMLLNLVWREATPARRRGCSKKKDAVIRWCNKIHHPNFFQNFDGWDSNCKQHDQHVWFMTLLY